jgi:hypothetical protein
MIDVFRVRKRFEQATALVESNEVFSVAGSPAYGA